MKIDYLDPTRLTNAQHLAYTSSFLDLLKSVIPTAIDLTVPMCVAMSDAVNTEDESFKIVVESIFTEQLSKCDHVRDYTYSGLKAQIKLFLNHFDDAFQSAAKRVEVELKPFGDINRLMYDAQTTSVVNVLQVMKGKLAGDIELLGLTRWVTELEEANNNFNTLFNDRFSEQKEKNALTRLREARTNTDAAYRAIVNRINAAIIFNGPEKYADFVAEVNLRVKYYKDAIAQSKGRAAAKKEKEQQDEPKTESETN